MKLRFRLYIRRTEQGTYIVTLPGVPKFVPLDERYEDYPASPHLAAYGPVIEEVKTDIREALQRWLPVAAPSWIEAASNYHPEQYLDSVTLELRPANRQGKRRAVLVPVTFSLIVDPPDEDGDRFVIAPALGDEGLKFYWFADDDLKTAASREITVRCAGMTAEELRQFRPARDESLDELEVSFTPLPPRTPRHVSSSEDAGYSELNKVAIDLTEMAREKRLRRTYGRTSEVDEILFALSSQSSPSVMVTGRAECGKSAIIHEVVRRIIADRCPEALKNRRVYETSPDHLHAGCMYTGQWEERLSSVLDTVSRQRHILVIRDVAGLFEAGQSLHSDRNMGQSLKPCVADGTITVIGGTNDERRRFLESRDPSFAAMFRVMEIAEPDRETTLSIIRKVAADLERQHSLKIDPGIFEAVYHLCRRFQPYRAFPGKAVRFLEQLAFDIARQHESEEHKAARDAAARPPVVDKIGHNGLHPLHGSARNGPLRPRTPQHIRDRRSDRSEHHRSARCRSGGGRLAHRHQSRIERPRHAARLPPVRRADRREHNDGYMGELVASAIELRRSTDYLEIEILAEINGWDDSVSMDISPVGARRGSGLTVPWPITLMGMYAAYAQRKGHAFSVAAFDRASHRRGGLAWKQIETLDGPDHLVAALAEHGYTRSVITIRGSATAALLAGEEGLHKLSDEASGRSHLTLVRRSDAQADASALNLLYQQTPEAGSATTNDLPPVVRVYTLAGQRRISDPRTGHETRDTDAVLAGDIDDFLLAYARANLNIRED